MWLKKKLKLNEFQKIFLIVVLVNYNYLFSQANNNPKNIIIMIGDGMGVNYVSAAVLSDVNNPFRKFSSIGLSITRAANKLVTDSAPGASAISTGVSVNYLAVAEDPFGNQLKTVFDEAKELGMSAGLVVTSSVTDATPAAFVAHVSNRKAQTEIAKQFLQKDIDVVIGGGEEFFSDSLFSNYNISWTDALSQAKYEVFLKPDSLFNKKPSNKFYAILDKKHLSKAINRNYSLADLTRIALNTLSRNENGFILMVEGSQIDWGGHENDKDYILSELKDFTKAITVALDFAENNNTLVLVTADHETGGMSITDGKIDGSELTMKFNTTGHTAEMVGVFAKGPGEESFRGIYENFMIGQKLFQLINPSYKF